jgi:hypothetical protein
VLSGNTFGMEILKLPALVQHYTDHERDEHPDLGIMGFLWEHYVDDEHSDESDGHCCDEKLPFKHCSNCCTHHTAVVVFMLPEQPAPVAPLLVENIPASFPQDQFLSFYECCIWQPPQLVQ